MEIGPLKIAETERFGHISGDGWIFVTVNVSFFLHS